MDFSWAESADEKLATLASNDFSNYPYCTKSRKTHVLMFSFYHEASLQVVRYRRENEGKFYR
jgi:hypothetical protein